MRLGPVGKRDQRGWELLSRFRTVFTIRASRRAQNPRERNDCTPRARIELAAKIEQEAAEIAEVNPDSRSLISALTSLLPPVKVLNQLASIREAFYRNSVDDSQLAEYGPVLLLLLVAIAFSFGGLAASVLLGFRGKRNRTKDTAYECGMIPIGEGNTRMSVKFYLVAMLFILFVGYIYALKKNAFDWKN